MEEMLVLSLIAACVAVLIAAFIIGYARTVKDAVNDGKTWRPD